MNRLDLPTGLGLVLRSVEEKDADFLDALYRSSWPDLLAIRGEQHFIEQIVRTQGQMQMAGYQSAFPGAQYLVLESGEGCIGRVAVDFDSTDVRLIDIVLLPQAQNKGYGSAVIRALQKAATDNKVPLRLAVHRDNPGARRLYRMLGFEIENVDAMAEQMIWRP